MAPFNSKTPKNLGLFSINLIKGLLRRWFMILLSVYQLFLSPLLGPRCRFYPSCSNYAKQAINQQGLARGLKLTLIRLSKCHPLNKGGIDEVPADHRSTGCTHSH